MEAMKEVWTDERLDDLNHRVDELGRRMDEGFSGMRAEFRSEIGALRTELRTEFRSEFGSLQSGSSAANNSLRAEMSAASASLRVEMNARFDAQEARFDGRFNEIQRAMMAMMGTMVLGFASLVATQL